MRRPRRRIETVRVGNAAVKIYRRTRTVDGKARCAGTRLAPITENLARWLSPLAKESGPVWPHGQTWRERARSISAAQKATAEAAGLLPWRHNSLRHSFCTFRAAATKNVPQTALEAGNSAATIFSHYRALANEAEGKAWFAVVPPHSGRPVTRLCPTLYNPAPPPTPTQTNTPLLLTEKQNNRLGIRPSR